MATDYNYSHFRTSHLIIDTVKTLRRVGVRPGNAAPDFELVQVDGLDWRLSEHLDRPVLLHFGSFS